jgi:hypothetical protein
MIRGAEISFEKAIEMTENALSEVGQVAMQQIRRGAEVSSHVEAAERDLRGALRQLVLAEREPPPLPADRGTNSLRE